VIAAAADGAEALRAGRRAKPAQFRWHWSDIATLVAKRLAGQLQK